MPIVVSLVMIVLSFILLYAWLTIFNGLTAFGESIKDMGSVGLHHALNNVFWFDVAGINDIPNFLGEGKSIAQGTAIVGVTGMYQAGFFPI